VLLTAPSPGRQVPRYDWVLAVLSVTGSPAGNSLLYMQRPVISVFLAALVDALFETRVRSCGINNVKTARCRDGIFRLVSGVFYADNADCFSIGQVFLSARPIKR